MAERDIWGSQDQRWTGGEYAPEQEPDNPWGTPTTQSPWSTQQQQYRTSVADQYKQWLGRDASDAELNDQFGNNYTQSHYQAVSDSIRNSPEAQAYAARQSTAGQPQTSQQDTSGWNTEGYATPGYTAANASKQAMSGWEQSNWDNQNEQTPKYVVGRILSQFDPKDPQALAKALPEIQKAYPGATVVGGDKLQLFPGDPPVDVWQAYEEGKGGQGWWWGSAEEGGASSGGSRGGSTISSLMGGGGGAGAGGGQAGYSATPTFPDPFTAMGGGVWTGTGWVPKDHPAAQGITNATANGSTTFTSTTGSEPPAGANEALWAQLMQRAQQGTNVTREDPIVRAQADAYSAQQERARRNYLGDVAEGSSPYATGSMRNEERMTAEKLGQNTGAMEAELMGREITARRDEIQNALSTMGELLTEHQRQSLQRELAQMNNSLERLRLDNQNAQYYAGLSQADRHFLAQQAQQSDFYNRDDAYRWGTHLDNFGANLDERDRYWDWQYRNE